MAVLMVLEIPGATVEQYEKANELMGIRGDEDAPEGLIEHIAAFDGNGMFALDVWESEAAFNAFAEARLMPVVKGELGIPGEPNVTFSDAHRWYDAAHGQAGS